MSGVGLVHGGAVTRLASLAPEVAARVVTLARSLAPHARIVAEIEGHEFGVNLAPHPDELWAKLAVNGLGVPLTETESCLREELGGALEVYADRSVDVLEPRAARRVEGSGAPSPVA